MCTSVTKDSTRLATLAYASRTDCLLCGGAPLTYLASTHSDAKGASICAGHGQLWCVSCQLSTRLTVFLPPV